MDEYKKYPIHGVCELDDFVKSSRRTSSFTFNIQPIAGIRRCTFLLKIEYPGTTDSFIWPLIKFGPTSEKFDRIVSQQFLRIVNETPEESVVYERNISHSTDYSPSFYGNRLRMEHILKKGNGWLEYGTLQIEYGVYVERVKVGKLWKFNFWDPIFDCDEKQHMITLKSCDGKLSYTHKQLLTFHSPKYYTVPPDWNIVDQYDFKVEKMETCLQLAHGVRMKLDEPKLKSIIPIARSMKLYNVVHYCQYQLMTYKEKVENLKFAFEFHTRHYSTHLMKKLESRKELKVILEEMDIQKMSGESMKQCTRFFFDGKI